MVKDEVIRRAVHPKEELCDRFLAKRVAFLPVGRAPEAKDGFTLHAATHAGALDLVGREALCNTSAPRRGPGAHHPPPIRGCA